MIRQATASDIPSIYPLILTIWEDMAFPFLKLASQEDFKSTMLTLMADDRFKWCYHNVIVHTTNEKVDGILYGYEGAKEGAYDEFFYDYIDDKFPKLNIRNYTYPKESHDKEWYLDALVVDSNARGKGIGTTLLKELPKHIQTPHPIGLNCDVTNPRAYKLYQSLGFNTVYEISFLGHTYFHMEKAH